jgi:hypothetical protein
MNTVRIIFVAGLLSVSSAYAQDGANWSAAIGTGRASATAQTTVVSAGSPSSPHSTAAIGTGRVAEKANRVDSNSTAFRLTSGSSVRAGAHWTAAIGTGRAVDSGTRVTASKSLAERGKL